MLLSPSGPFVIICYSGLQKILKIMGTVTTMRMGAYDLMRMTTLLYKLQTGETAKAGV